jgi:thymidylate synthase
MFNPIVNKSELLILDEKDSVGCGDTAICTLWSPKVQWNRLVKGVNFSEVDIVGNLYTVRGIENMVRNLRANPHIKNLYFVGMDLSNGKLKAAIEDVLENGMFLQTINGERIYVDLFHVNICWRDELLSEATKKCSIPLIVAPPPITCSDTETVPSIGYMIHARTLKEAYTAIMNYVQNHGTICGSRYGNRMKEALGLQVVIDELGLVDDILDIDDADKYATSLLDASDKGTTYNYGERLADGVDKVMNKVGGRTAYFPIFRLSDVDNNEPSCLVSVWFRCQDGKRLDGIWFVRSQDMCNGWPFNAYGWYAYQNMLSTKYELEMGQFCTVTGSAHIYERDWDISSTNEILRDPLGDFVVSTEDGEIVVTQHDSSGDIIAWFSEKSAERIQRKMQHRVRSINHAMYLGRELQKMEQRLKEESLLDKEPKHEPERDEGSIKISGNVWATSPGEVAIDIGDDTICWLFRGPCEALYKINRYDTQERKKIEFDYPISMLKKIGLYDTIKSVNKSD